jgi:hypothetical protein
MMGRQKSDQGQLFYEFHLGDAVSEDHLVRKIDAALDLSWLRSELAPHYSSMGRPSIDPELMIRMLVVGYVFALRSERLICREVQVNLAYRWFCKLGIEDAMLLLILGIVLTAVSWYFAWSHIGPVSEYSFCLNRLLQQNRHETDMAGCPSRVRFQG